MKDTAGQTLQAIAAEQGPLPASEVTAIGLDLCRALAAVHDAGRPHRDINAQNVLREAGGRIVLMDVGTGGDPVYLAPELFRGGQASVASDIYALGVLMFFLATGRYPVSGATIEDVQAAHRGGHAAKPALPPGLPDGLRSAIDTALAADPFRRHATARAFERALLPLPAARAIGESAKPAGHARRRHTRSSRSPWRTWRIPAGLVFVLAIGAWAVWTASRSGTSGSNRPFAAGQVWIGPDVRTEGSVSPDGRFLSAISADAGLMLHDLQAGTDRALTHGDVGLNSVEASVISRDGRSVAYAWRDETTHRVELRTVSTDPGSQTSRTLVNAADLRAIVPYDWSPDGQSIAVALERSDRIVRLAMISVTDGTTTELKPIDWRGTTRAVFSPDGRFLAYDLAGADSPDRDVYVMDVRSPEENPAIVRAGNDTLVGWRQDGPSLVFLSDHSGAIGVWTAPFVEHGLAGPAVIVKPDLGPRAFAIGLTPPGVLVYGVQASSQHIVTAEVDFETGKMLSGPTDVSASFLLKNANPDWSGDYTRLAFRSERPNNVSALSILTLDRSAPLRELRPNLSEFQRPRWMADGSIAVQGIDSTGRQGIYRIDSSSGLATPVLVIGPGVTCTQASWMPDGRVVYRRGSSGRSEIVIRDPASGAGADTVLFSPIRRGLIDGLSLSPDGTHVAWIQNDSAAKSSVVLVMPVSGGPIVEVAWAAAPTQLSGLLEWTPDGQRLVFSEATLGGDPSQIVVNSVPVAAGAPVTVEGLRPTHGTNTLRIHQDGRRVVYSAGDIKLEVHTLANFLPAARQP